MVIAHHRDERWAQQVTARSTSRHLWPLARQWARRRIITCRLQVTLSTNYKDAKQLNKNRMKAHDRAISGRSHRPPPASLIMAVRCLCV